jgi:adenosylmethionine-8-amino-7-oxononanoate aminotransferase
VPVTRDPVAADHAHLLHPLHHPSLHQTPKIWVEGRGTTIRDADGRDYLDGLAGLWNVNVGHGRRELAEAAMAQMATLAYCSSYAGSSNHPAIELAERLSEVTYRSINSFYFTSGGAEATDSSIKTARFYWKAVGKPDKTKIIARRRGYHGLTLAAMSATGIPAFWPMFEPRVPGFVHIDAPDPYRFVNDNPSISLGVAAANPLERAILDEGPDTVAAFIAEPVQGAGGVIIAPGDYFPRVREICDRYGVLLIADDVITGFGRTGRWFGLEHYGVEPDIMQFAKGVTSGYVPLGGIGVSDAIREVMNSVPPAKRWMHAYTYSGHPTCCAVALANLRIIHDEQLVERAAAMGAHLAKRLAALAPLDRVGHVRSLGLIAAVEIVADKATKAQFPAETALNQRLYEALLERGLYTRVLFDCICLSPPLVVTEAEIDRMVAIIGEAIPAVIG